MFRTKDTYGRPKYAARSKAVVIDNRDPLKRGRIQVNHALLGETVWIDYLRLPGIFDVPSIGDLVYVEADCGEFEFPLAWGNCTKGPDDAPDIPAEFKRNVPTNRGMFSPGGHILEMDDGLSNPTNSPNDKSLTTTNRGIRITSSTNNRLHLIDDPANNNQYVLLADAGGNFIKLDYKNNVLSINAVGSSNVTTTTDKEETVGGNFTIIVAGTASITANQIRLNGTAGDVLTTTTDPVVDTIFGTPTIGVPTVKSG